MAQRQADVHQDKLCPPNKRYALMDANKKIDLNNPLCPNKSKIMANILQNHPLRFSIAASSSVSWIYLGKFWHTLKEDGSKYRLKFVLDRKEITMTLNDFKRIFQLPQATDNNHERFVAAPKFSKRSWFYTGIKNVIQLQDNWSCTTMADTWQDVKSIFNSGKNKAGVGMKIPSWMITDEMKLTENYQMYTAVFGVDVPMTQSQPIESTQGTHRRTSAPRSPNPDVDEGESKKVKEHLVAEETEKMVEGTKSDDAEAVDDSILNGQNDPDTRLDLGSYKESLEVEKTVVVQPVNVMEEKEVFDRLH
ncbi:hypothetical protein Tco_1541177 [Tanacetum coccineum]